MNNQKLKESSRKLLSEGHIDEAILNLRLWSKTYPNHRLSNEIIHVSARYQTEREKLRFGIVKHDEYTIQVNKIYRDLTDILNLIPEQNLPVQSKKNTSEKKEETTHEAGVEMSFFNWFQQKNMIVMRCIFAIVAIIGGVLVLSAVIALNQDDSEKVLRELTCLSIIANIIIALLAIWVTSKARINKDLIEKLDELLRGTPASASEYYERAKSATYEFTKCWKLVWIGWVLLYCIFFLKFFHDNEDIKPIKIIDSLNEKLFIEGKEIEIQFWIDACSYISSFGLIVCFSILYHKSRSRDKHYMNVTTIFSGIVFY